MNLSFELTSAHLISIGMAFVGALWALVKIIVTQQDKRMGEKFDAVVKALGTVGQDLRHEAEETRKLESAFHRFQAELPREYVRRNDFLRSIGTLETRIDNFALRMERALMQPKE